MTKAKKKTTTVKKAAAKKVKARSRIETVRFGVRERTEKNDNHMIRLKGLRSGEYPSYALITHAVFAVAEDYVNNQIDEWGDEYIDCTLNDPGERLVLEAVKYYQSSAFSFNNAVTGYYLKCIIAHMELME